MKKHIAKFILTACALLLAVTARADGEQRNHEAGTKWVDPVEFFELQDIDRTDFQRDYDQGDIDFNKVLQAKGVKIYGLRLKPIAGALHVEKNTQHHFWHTEPGQVKLDYQDLYGIRGVPLHEAGFCVYMDDPVSLSYTFSYKAQWENSVSYITHTFNTFININNLRLTTSNSGINFSYNISAKQEGFYHATNKDNSSPTDFKSEDDKRTEFTSNGNSRYGHFIYFNGSRDLLVMISTPKNAESDKDWVRCPWCRVYFIVEEILVEDEGGAFLSEEDRTELVDYLDGLTAWLGGEGDPLGLGEHTDATTSAVIGAIGTVASILLGNGLAGMLGGGASSLVDTLINSATSGANPLPGSDAPDLSKMEGLKGRKPEEEEEEKEQETPPPPAEKLDFFDKYTRTDADGDIHVKDPVTGKTTVYVDNGDGTYTNLTTGQSWTPEEINDRLGYREDNKELLGKDAKQAADNAEKQHQKWLEESSQLSQDAQDYLNWKHAQEAAMEKEIKIDHLAHKYGVPPDERIIKNTIKHEQELNQIDSELNKAESDILESKEKYLETVAKTCDVAVDVMGGCVPGGAVVKDVYTFSKSTLVAASEAIADGKSASEGVAHVLVGMGNGALGVIQNQAGDLAGNGKYAWAKELGINVLTEDLKEGMNAAYEGKSLDEIAQKLVNTTGSKTAEFGVGKLISAGMGKLKDTAKASLDPTDVDPDKFYFKEETAKKIDYWLNQKHTVHAGHRADVFKVSVDAEKGISVAKGQGFSLFYSGKVDTGALAEWGANKAYSETIGNDWGGKVAEWANDKAVEGAASVMAGDRLDQAMGASPVFSVVSQQEVKQITDFAKTVGQFSDMAAKFRKK